MQQKMISLVDEEKRVLRQMQAMGSSSPSVAAMRCRCVRSRRITNVLMDWERRNRKRMLRYREYKRLRDCVPSIARKDVSKLTIITEAVSLIDRLEAAVLHKMQSQGVPKCLQGLELKSSSTSDELNAEDLKHLMLQLMAKPKQTTSKSKTKSMQE